ncbi:hypothetical protein HYW61_01875 [candidate division WWE3 bacterium]|nr:hypothetical protein [candidate division WWE3 bacterium]
MKPAFLLITTTFFALAGIAFAQGISISVPIEGNVAGGTIISFAGGRYAPSGAAYDPAIFGVVVVDPVVALEEPESTRPLVLTEGEALVRVSGVGGSIRVGDYVTTSDISGVGQKVTYPGNALGVALEDFIVDKDPKAKSQEQGAIRVQIGIRPVVPDATMTGNLFEIVKRGMLAPFLTPVNSLRYILALFVAAGAFMIGFNSFGKTSESGIEALGRNPLAKGAIQASVIINFILTTVIMFVGLLLAYLILVL